MTAAEIATALGSGARRSGQWWRCVCPVHGSRTGRSLTLALRDHERGLVVHCYAGCGRDDIIAELRRCGLIGDRAERSPLAAVSNDVANDDARRVEIARRLWAEAKDARGTLVGHYLAGRGITMVLPSVLRFSSRCRHPSGVLLPAMLARIDSIDGELIGIYRTFLRPDGSGKADVEPQKAMLGRAAGGAVRLAPAAETLLVGEGIENSLAAMQSTAMPVWAALSAPGIERLALPAVVRVVVICADNDASGAGQRAARTLARRLLAEGRRVRIALPPELGTDFADVLAGHAYAGVVEVRDAAA